MRNKPTPPCRSRQNDAILANLSPFAEPVRHDYGAATPQLFRMRCEYPFSTLTVLFTNAMTARSIREHSAPAFDANFCEKLYRHWAGSLFAGAHFSQSEKIDFLALASNPAKAVDFCAQQLFSIECLVNDLLAERLTHLTPFGHRDEPLTIMAKRSRSASRQLPALIMACRHLSPLYRYSPRITAFREALRAIGMLDPLPPDSAVHPETQRSSISAWRLSETFNHLLKALQTLCCNSKFRKDLRERNREAHRCFTLYRDYFRSTFQNCNRVLVLRLNLTNPAPPLDDRQRDPLLIYDDFDQLIANRRSNRLFNNRLGYIAKLAYSPPNGLYWQALFFFDGEKGIDTDHVLLANAIGRYWVKAITRKQGAYRNYNRYQTMPKTFPSELMIPHSFGAFLAAHQPLRDDFELRALGILCKSSEFFSLAIPPENRRQIRKGG